MCGRVGSVRQCGLWARAGGDLPGPGSRRRTRSPVTPGGPGLRWRAGGLDGKHSDSESHSLARLTPHRNPPPGHSSHPHSLRLSRRRRRKAGRQQAFRGSAPRPPLSPPWGCCSPAAPTAAEIDSTLSRPVPPNPLSPSCSPLSRPVSPCPVLFPPSPTLSPRPPLCPPTGAAGSRQVGVQGSAPGQDLPRFG